MLFPIVLMVQLAIFVALIAVISSAAGGDLFGLDETLYNQLRTKKTSDEIASEFMDSLFSRMTGRMLQSEIVLPPLEMDVDSAESSSDYFEDRYMCAKETKLPLSEIRRRKPLGSPGWGNTDDFATGRILISADLIIKFGELQVELAQNNKGSIIPKTKVRFNFEGENVIRLLFSIPNFPHKNVKSPQCLVQIEELSTVTLANPQLLNEDEIKRDTKLGGNKMVMVKKYIAKMPEEYKISITVGMYKAVKEKLPGDDFWVCVSPSMAATARANEMEYKRKENKYYKKYCGSG